MMDSILRRPVRAFLLLALVAGAALAAWVHQRARTEALNDTLAVGQQRLGLYGATIRSALDRFSYLPATMALDRDVRELLRDPAPGRVDAINRKLEAINDRARSASLYIMNTRGVTLAASNWRTPLSYVGKDYGFRPYFARALSVGAGHFFGIGVTTKLPGYFLAEGVRDEDGAVLGAVVVKIDLEHLESDWGQGDDAVMVTDEDGVVILTNRPEWKYAIDGEVTDDLRRRLDGVRRYGAIPLRSLRREALRQLGDSARMERAEETRYIAQSATVEEEGWTIHHLVDWDRIEARVRAITALVVLGWLALVLLGLYLRQRRLALRAQLDARGELERLVDLRTRALRETQDELIHAGKMAALGQMSAAVTHELNQPLAAIQTFVASTRLFLEQGDTATVGRNLTMIEDLGRRMAELIRHLKVFARKSPTSSRPFDPAPCMGRALALLEPRLRRAGIRVVAACPEGFTVSGDSSRLEQVFVNLLANAIDALEAEKGADRRIGVGMAAEGDGLIIRVSDNGPGIAPEALGHVFEPFFTTKEVGDGLGLGLSLSYGIIRDMGGAIRADNAAEGGAVFTITLPRSGGDK
jgi:two-component system C4-dicarboxylate transport sensor histidine kinase DctB